MRRASSRKILMTLGGGVLALWLADATVAADRCVLAEEYTATWCGPCVYSGVALGQLQDEHPADLALLQIHVGDSYTLPWGTSRFNSYPLHGSVPNVWFDGLVQHVGADQFVYPIYASMFAERAAIPADVRLDFGAVPVSGATFTFQARVRLENGAAPRAVRVYIARALDHYPNGAHYRNCLREAASYAALDLLPGETYLVERTMTFESVSWNQQPNIRALAWVEQPVSSGPRAVYQARRIAWPLPPLPAEFQAGDLNCSGAVDFADINPFVLAVSSPAGYEAAYPGCDRQLADINADGSVDFADINPFVALLSPEPSLALQILKQILSLAY